MRNKYIINKGREFIPYGYKETVLALEDIDIRSVATFNVLLQDNTKTTIAGIECPHIIKTLREHRNRVDLLIHISDDLYEEGLCEEAYTIAILSQEIAKDRFISNTHKI